MSTSDHLIAQPAAPIRFKRLRLGIVVLGLTGVEQAATYSTMVRNGRATMLAASIGVLLLVTLVYLLGSWSYQVFYGDAAEDIMAFAAGSPVRVLS